MALFLLSAAMLSSYRLLACLISVLTRRLASLYNLMFSVERNVFMFVCSLFLAFTAFLISMLNQGWFLLLLGLFSQLGIKFLCCVRSWFLKEDHAISICSVVGSAKCNNSPLRRSKFALLKFGTKILFSTTLVFVLISARTTLWSHVARCSPTMTLLIRWSWLGITRTRTVSC